MSKGHLGSVNRAVETNERNANIPIFRAECSCGWRGQWEHYISKAQDAKVAHCETAEARTL